MKNADSAEQADRARLGIPADARRVLVLAESTHWDPNWLRTSGEYFHGLVAPGLEMAVRELRQDPRRVYSIECVFFLRMFWEARPDLQDALRELLNSGRMRLTGSGVTTPDTLLPSSEAILRDMLVGQEWLRAAGVTQEPRLAYFPDCFGHSPNLPALLNAAGFDRSAVTRIDGMWFLSADLDLPSNFPLKGSSAELLLKKERSLDFVWRARDGSEVLCHWNAFTYFQGDLLADAGFARTYLYPNLTRPDRSDKTVARRVKEFVKQLAPASRTPYLFCPIGMDFNPPIERLGELVERYNRFVYPTSGVWVVNAALDDYLDLLEPYRASLPALALDPNPYWTGFYTSRPSLKRRARRLWERLALVEQAELLCERESLVSRRVGRSTRRQDAAWWGAAVSNHHDFITGTSPDRVVDLEQAPMLDGLLRQAGREVELLRSELRSLRSRRDIPPAPTVTLAPAARSEAQPAVRKTAGGLEIETARLCLRLSPEGGGRIMEVRAADGSTLLQGQETVLYEESGGLWRMGYEFRGGSFRQAGLRIGPARFDTAWQHGCLWVGWETRLGAMVVAQSLWIPQDEPLVYFQVEGAAPEKSTLVWRWQLPYSPERLEMEAPGGVVERPPEKVYKRPFWPVQQFLHLPNPGGGRGFGLLLRGPGAAAVGPGGQVEAVALRNANRERAYRGMFTLMGMPVGGFERERTAWRGALAFPELGEEPSLPALARGLVSAPWAGEEDRLSAWTAGELARVEGCPQVFVSAVKPAWRGEGVIVRLEAPSIQPGTTLTARLKLGFAAHEAWLCDARERDLAPLPLPQAPPRRLDGGDTAQLQEGMVVEVPVDRAIVTLRLV